MAIPPTIEIVGILAIRVMTQNCPSCKQGLELKESYSNIYKCKNCRKEWFFLKSEAHEIIKKTIDSQEVINYGK